MSTSNLNDLYDNLYMLLLSLNKEFFNHNVIMKKFTLPHSHIKVLFYLIYCIYYIMELNAFII